MVASSVPVDAPIIQAAKKNGRPAFSTSKHIHRIVSEMDVLVLCGYRLGGVPDLARNGGPSNRITRRWYAITTDGNTDQPPEKSALGKVVNR